MCEEAEGENEAVDVFGCAEVGCYEGGLGSGSVVLCGAGKHVGESLEGGFENEVDEYCPEGKGLPECDEALVCECGDGAGEVETHKDGWDDET